MFTVPRTRSETAYNRAHVLTRNIIEWTNGLLKKRFQVLCKEMRFSPERCANIVVACAVLHNFGISVGDVVINEDAAIDIDDHHFHFAPQNDVAGLEVRQNIILNHFG